MQLLSPLLKRSEYFTNKKDKRTIVSTLEKIDDQLRWIEQKLTMKVDNEILKHYNECREEVKKIENLWDKYKS